MNNSAIYEFKIIKLILSIVNLKKKKNRIFGELFSVFG